MSEVAKHSTPVETRLAKYLAKVTKGADINFTEVLEQIPVDDRPRVHAVLSGLAEEASNAETVEAPRAPAIITPESKDVQAMIETLKLEEGYADAVETQKVFELTPQGEAVPDFANVLKTFSSEMLAKAQAFQSPKLVLTSKDRSFNDLVDAINGHKKMDRQNDTYVDGIFQKHANQKPENWGAHIIESPTDVAVQDFDDKTLRSRERLANFADYKKANGIQGMDRFKYAHAMMQALKNGEPIDMEFWTMLDEDPALSGSHVPHAYWHPDYRRVDFDWGHPGDRYGSGRLRRSVGGDVPNA